MSPVMSPVMRLARWPGSVALALGLGVLAAPLPAAGAIATPDSTAARAGIPATALARPGTSSAHWRMALPGERYRFPRDHASHPDYQTEWWYYTGHLASGERRFGYQLTFFRVGLDPSRVASVSAWAPHSIFFAHAAVTDETGRRYHADSRVMRPALGLAGADTTAYHVWVDDWSAALAPDGHAHLLHANADGFALDLALTPDKPVVVHGENGVSPKSAGLGRASHYLSFTRMTTRGRVTVDGASHDVAGVSWMDHEYGSNQLGPGQRGWDWFSVQLDDGRELMFYRLRLANGRIEPSSSGTLVARDGSGRHLALAAFRVTSDDAWTSPKTGAVYPLRWRLELPGEELDLTLEPTVHEQEMVTPPPLAFAYWEGSVTVRGTSHGRPIHGVGYVELTGYSGAVPGF